MELLPKELEEKFPKLGTTDEVPANSKKVVAKYFDSMGSWTWLAVEGQREGNDFVFFGLVNGFEPEWGYFSLSELESVNKSYPRIERDLYLGEKTIGEVMNA